MLSCHDSDKWQGRNNVGEKGRSKKKTKRRLPDQMLTRVHTRMQRQGEIWLQHVFASEMFDQESSSARQKVSTIGNMIHTSSQNHINGSQEIITDFFKNICSNSRLLHTWQLQELDSFKMSCLKVKVVPEQAPSVIWSFTPHMSFTPPWQGSP